MKKFSLYLLCTFLIAFNSQAQTRVFKEVSNGISTKLRSIMQDGSLVGYITFTELEKASKDSFNYEITIMDENLNDIGKVKFREQKLDLYEVAFEQDILCFTYTKSDVLGNTPRHKISYHRAAKRGYVSYFAQFINLKGEIIKTFEKKADIDIYLALKQSETGISPLKHNIQLRNIAGTGFACFYGDKSKKYLLTFNTAGEKITERQVKEDAASFYLHAAGNDLYLLTQKLDNAVDGGYTLVGYSGTENSPSLKYQLKDKKQRSYELLSFDNDPVTGKLCMSGMVLNKRWENGAATVSSIYRGGYHGIFSIEVNSAHKEDIKSTFIYWDEGKKKGFTPEGRFTKANAFFMPRPSFRDYNGNTYFLGSNIERKKSKRLIAAAIYMSPLIYPPIMLAAMGFKEYSIEDISVLQMDGKGEITVVGKIPSTPIKRLYKGSGFKLSENRGFIPLTNPEKKSTVIIMKDVKDITIYDVQEKKVLRKIPYNTGDVTTNIYPAKDGHIIVSEYNIKDRSTKLSIEAI